MTFIKVKENKFLDIDRGVSVEVHVDRDPLVRDNFSVLVEALTSKEYTYPTLEEAVLAAASITSITPADESLDPTQVKFREVQKLEEIKNKERLIIKYREEHGGKDPETYESFVEWQGVRPR